MITEKDCIALIKKYRCSDFDSVYMKPQILIYEPDTGLMRKIFGGRWTLRDHKKYFFLCRKFEDVKDQIIDFFLKVDPELDQYFLNKKHQHILKQPKVMEAL
jgi:hypothetical protein